MSDISDEQLDCVGRTLEIELGDERSFILIVVSNSKQKGIGYFSATTNASTKTLEQIYDWMGKEMLPEAKSKP